MNWNNFNTYGDSQQRSFENMCNQLFEKHLRHTHREKLTKFRVINGAGGDGGIEAYGELNSGEIIAVQSKWFREVLKDSQISQIWKSVETALSLRPHIKEYVICIPHDVSSLKYGRGKKGEGKKPIENYEEKAIDDFTDEIKVKYPNITLTWWFEKHIELQLQKAENEGIHKFWFEKEVISIDYLQSHFNLQKKSWLNERYVPELHGRGIIHKEYEKVCFLNNYRKELNNIIEKSLIDVAKGISSINQFVEINQKDSQVNSELCGIEDNLKSHKNALFKLKNAIEVGNDLYVPEVVSGIHLWNLVQKLNRIKPDNLQKSKLPKLVSVLENIHKYNLPEFTAKVGGAIRQRIKLILGEPGTGKTHGLVNCVETHLSKNSPGLIIQAKGCPCSNWTEILSTSLELHGWNKHEIFAALESVAIRKDIQNAISLEAGAEQKSESTKIIICVDGLEEGIENEENWYGRIRECEELVKSHPRLCFLFSARRYFYDNRKVPTSDLYSDIFLPREGDVSIESISKKYFSKQHYNIKISSPTIIKGIDSLFALRLFCEQYKNSTLSNSDEVVTATNDLLNLKIEKVNGEFLLSLNSKKGKTRNPVLESLISIADYFYSNVKSEHDELVQVISPPIKAFLDSSEIDCLIDFLTDYGFLVKSERIEKDGVFKRKFFLYNVAYQSLIEYIISQRTYSEIANGNLTQIPEILHGGMVQPLDIPSPEIMLSSGKLPNKRIIQNVADELFLKDGKLIGEDGFLTEGFGELEIFMMQMEALRKAPKKLAVKYKERVDEMFLGSDESQYKIFKYLILPSCYSSESYFGADYLHNILINQPSAFERDKLWSGRDKYELGKLQEEERLKYDYQNILTVFQELNVEQDLLFPSQKHNEMPLVYAWGLSNINQYLRHSLRIALTDWAVKNPDEFILLLKNVFFSNDPQIQEDLATVMLGVASLLKEKNKIKLLSDWALVNIFSNIEVNRNIIVRQGFRAIVERAFQNGLLPQEAVEKARPQPLNDILPLRLDSGFLAEPKEEYYPIVHDLAWYVIKKSYDSFFEYPTRTEDGWIDRNCAEARKVLEVYKEEIQDTNISGSVLATAAALEHIRELGLTRESGNWMTDANHGSESKVFTYEEKYTWLAVHFLQGYFSDYIPIKPWSGEREFIKDYSMLTDIPNPSEYLLKRNDVAILERNEWVIKERLSKELDNNVIDIQDRINQWVKEEPNINFNNWILFNSADINFYEESKQWLALYNHTSLHDSDEICYSYIDVRACLIEQENLEALKKVIFSDPDRLHFLSHFDGIRSMPKTHTYCNPSDIVWMTWIEEEEKGEYLYSDGKKINLFHGLSRIVTDTLEGEEYRMLPSKIVREFLGVYELVGNELKNAVGNTLAITHKITDGSFRDNQEIVLTDIEAISKAIGKSGYEIVWFVELFKQKNPLNNSLPKNFHAQKARKYFVWNEEKELKHHKFWDERYTNKRDRLKDH